MRIRDEPGPQGLVSVPSLLAGLLSLRLLPTGTCSTPQLDSGLLPLPLPS